MTMLSPGAPGREKSGGAGAPGASAAGRCGLDAAKKVSLPVLAAAPAGAGGGAARAARGASNAWQANHPKIGHSKIGRWRALVLLLVHVGFAIHIAIWYFGKRAVVSPVEPSESMQTLREGVVNAGFVFFALAIVSTALLGRFFCGWGCHIVALQDACAWLMMRMGVRPKPFRSRLLMWFPLGLALYMFAWPVFHREVLRPLFMDARGRLPWILGQSDPIPGVVTQFLVKDFWVTFAPWYMVTPFLLVCTFGVVYFLGAKGYCTYGCPYGGFFAPVDLLAVGRIRVTDACNQCGHCTAVCTSNVRVHEEVRDFKMVVDPGCMKCLDCISVCPNDALYFGLGPPALLTKPRTAAARERRAQARAQRAARFDLSWPLELGLAVVFLALFMAYRAMMNAIPMLMAVGMALVVTFGVWKLWQLRPVRLGGAPNIRLQAMQLRYRGKWKPLAYVVALVTIASVAVAAWSGYVRATLWNADRLYAKLTTPLPVVLRPEFQAEPREAEIARRAIALFKRADSPRRGGHGWALLPDQELDIAYMEALLGDLDAAERRMERVIETGKPQDSLLQQAANLIQTRMVRDALYRPTPEQVKEADTRIVALHERALAKHDYLDGARFFLSYRKLTEGATPGGPGQPPVFRPESVSAARAMWDGPVNERHPRPGALMNLARLEMTIGGPGAAERARPLLERAAGAMEKHDADGHLGLARAYQQLGDTARATQLAEEAAQTGRGTGGLVQVMSADVLAGVGVRDRAADLVGRGTERASALGPHTGQAGTFVSAAGVLARLGKPKEAMSLYQRAATILQSGREPAPWDLLSLGQGMMGAGQGTAYGELTLEGLRTIERARDAAPGSSVVRAQLAEAYAAMERLRDAEREMVAAARLADRNAYVAHRLSQLYAEVQKGEEAADWDRVARERERGAAVSDPSAGR